MATVDRLYERGVISQKAMQRLASNAPRDLMNRVGADTGSRAAGFRGGGPQRPVEGERVQFESAGAKRKENTETTRTLEKPAAQMTPQEREAWKIKARQELEAHIAKVEKKTGKTKTLDDLAAPDETGRIGFSSLKTER